MSTSSHAAVRSSTDRAAPSNQRIARVLARVADLLETQQANPFRVRAYRNATHTLRGMRRSCAFILAQDGRTGLERLAGFGKRMAGTIEEIVHTGRLRLLDRLEGEVSPEDLFSTVPAVGEELARRIHEALGLETLEELELAAHDGRLARVRGFGPRRIQAVRESLQAMLSRSARRYARLLEERKGYVFRRSDAELARVRPPVTSILAIDEEYRRRVAEGTLRNIAPRRFNPSGEAWLPIYHAERDGWSFTALFSNTARAHRLGRTRDWVVIFYERDGEESQSTVVTETSGPLVGERVVRGREEECTALLLPDGSAGLPLHLDTAM